MKYSLAKTAIKKHIQSHAGNPDHDDDESVFDKWLHFLSFEIDLKQKLHVF